MADTPEVKDEAPPGPPPPPPPPPKVEEPEEAEEKSEAQVPSDEPVAAAPASEPDAQPVVARRPSVAEGKASKDARRTQLAAVRDFESTRNRYFVDQFDANKKYWGSLRELIMENDDNTDRVISYLTKKVAADRHYAASIYGLQDALQEEKKGSAKTRYDKERAKSGKGKDGSRPPSSRKGSLGGESAAGGDRDSYRDSYHSEDVGQTRHAIVELSDMDCHMAMALDDLCDFLENDVIKTQLQVMAKDTHKEFNLILEKGDACLETLRNIDKHTHTNYTDYTEAMQGNLQINDPSAGHSKDVWAADMAYRVAVGQQKDAWADGMRTLGELFTQMRALETRRRTVLKDALGEAVSKTEGTWRGLPELAMPVTACLGLVNCDPASIDEEIKQKMHKRTLRSQESEEKGKRASKGKGDKMEEKEGSQQHLGPAPANADFINQLESPLSSPLIRHVEVLERKEKSGLTSKWCLGLCVLTWDSYLHFFDAPKASRLKLESTPNAVFHELVPHIDLDKFKLGKKGEEGITVTAAFSLDMTKEGSAGTRKDNPKKTTDFEVTGGKKASSLKSTFGKDYTAKTYLLRSTSDRKAEEWVVKLRASSLAPGEGSGNAEVDEEKARAEVFGSSASTST